MKLADFRVLGMLPLQDHRGILPQNREKVMCGRVEGRRDLGQWVIEGHEGSQSAVMTSGDLIGGMHFPTASTALRQHGSWLFAAPGVALSNSKKETTTKSDNSVTRTRAQDKKKKSDSRTVSVGLAGNSRWAADPRYRAQVAGLHPDAADVSVGQPLIVLASTNENSQELLAFATGGAPLVAVNKAGDPKLGTLVYDLDKDDKPDKDRAARLHTFWRVAKLAGGKCLGGNDTLAWQLTLSGKDGLDGRGLVYDTPGASSGASGEAREEEGVPKQGEEGMKTSHGRITNTQEYMKKLLENYQERTQGKTPNQPEVPERRPGDETQTRPPPEKTETRPKEDPPKEKEEPPKDKPPEPLAAGFVLASITARSGGFLEVGDQGDVHRIGTTVDGEPVNAAHISCDALYKNSMGDGPLDFETQPWEDPTLGGPFLSPVHLRWDGGVAHGWCGGTAPGKWRWAAETFFFIPQDETKTVTGRRRDPKKKKVTKKGPKKPEKTDTGPPKECQTTPGGGGTGAGTTYDPGPVTRGDGSISGTGLPTSGGTTGDIGPFSDMGGNWVPQTYPGGTGQYAPSGSEPTDLGTDGGPNSNSGAGQTTVGGQLENWDPPEEWVDPPAGWGAWDKVDGWDTGPGYPGGQLPLDPGGLEPTRPDQKAGGGGGNGLTGVGPGGTSGTGYPPPSRGDGSISGGGLPIGGLSVFGGGTMTPSTYWALNGAGVIDEYGRPAQTPPPRVGDSDAVRKARGGGESSRTPTALQSMGFNGGIILGGYATAQGQTDFTNGGWIQDLVSVPANAGNVAAITVVAQGDGTWESFTAAGGGGQATAGGIVFGPPEFVEPSVLYALQSGDYNPGETASGSVGAGPVDLFLPGGGASMVFGTPGFSGVQGGGGVRLTHTQVGLEFDVLTSAGVSSGTSLLVGEGGVLITGPVHATGKATFDDIIDPTGIAFAEQAVRPANWPSPGAGVFLPGLYAGDTAGSNEAWWVRDDGTEVDLSLISGTSVLAADATLVSTVGAAEQTLKSYQFSAAQLSVGDQVKITAWGTFDDGVQTGSAFLRWGGTGGLKIGTGQGDGGDPWRIDAIVSITAAAGQEANGVTVYTSTGTTFVDHTSHTEAISGTIDLLLRGDNTVGSNNDATSVRGWKVELIQAVP